MDRGFGVWGLVLSGNCASVHAAFMQGSDPALTERLLGVGRHGGASRTGLHVVSAARLQLPLTGREICVCQLAPIDSLRDCLSRS